MIKDSGFIFSSNGGRLEKAAASQNCKDRISHTRRHIQKTKWAKVLNITIMLTYNYYYLHTTPHTNTCAQYRTA